jgi:Ni/Co efflux regulator RcnB
MKRTLLGMLAAAAAAATLSASGFAITAAAQSDQQPTHAELVRRWAEAALDAQVKGMKTSLRLNADQEKLWGPFESAVKDGAKARLVALQEEQGDNLSPMDRLNATADRLAQSAAILQKTRRPSPCTRASMMRRNTNSSRLDACWCPSAGALRWR